LVTALLFVAATCASAPAGLPPEGVSVVLAIGASTRVTETTLTVKFESVVADSRCPTGTNCVWAGDAAVKIQISAPETAPETAVLHTNLGTARPAVHDGWRIKLIDVTPVPKADGPPRPEDYRITLLIDRPR
jgi:hypothetical protein